MQGEATFKNKEVTQTTSSLPPSRNNGATSMMGRGKWLLNSRKALRSLKLLSQTSMTCLSNLHIILKVYTSAGYGKGPHQSGRLAVQHRSWKVLRSAMRWVKSDNKIII
jgi:hypothetical protein